MSKNFDKLLNQHGDPLTEANFTQADDYYFREAVIKWVDKAIENFKDLYTITGNFRSRIVDLEKEIKELKKRSK